MPNSKALLVSTLLILFTSLEGLNALPKDTCDPIDVEVHQKSTDPGATIEVDLKGQDVSRFSINLIMPKGRQILDAKTLMFNNLERGKYIVVVTSTDENDNYCPTYINVSIE